MIVRRRFIRDRARGVMSHPCHARHIYPAQRPALSQRERHSTVTAPWTSACLPSPSTQRSPPPSPCCMPIRVSANVKATGLPAGFGKLGASGEAPLTDALVYDAASTTTTFSANRLDTESIVVDKASRPCCLRCWPNAVPTAAWRASRLTFPPHACTASCKARHGQRQAGRHGVAGQRQLHRHRAGRGGRYGQGLQPVCKASAMKAAITLSEVRSSAGS